MLVTRREGEFCFSDCDTLEAQKTADNLLGMSATNKSHRI